MHRVVHRVRAARRACLPCPCARALRTWCAESPCLCPTCRRCFCRSVVTYVSATGLLSTPPTPLHPTRARMRMPNTPPCRSLCGPSERLPMPCNRMLCARSGDRLLPPQEHGASGMGSGVRPRPRSPIFKGRARVPTLTLTPPCAGVATGAWRACCGGGGARVAMAAPLPASGRSPHPKGAVQ